MYRVVIVFLFLASPALAKDKTPEPEILFPAITEVEFGALDVNAKVVKPKLELVGTRQSAEFKSLLRLRTDFKSEMRVSVAEVQ